MKIATFEEFLQAVFDPPNACIPSWYDEEDFELETDTLIDWYIHLFSEPELLFGRFNPEQLERGFGAMINCNFQLAVSELVWETTVPLEHRLRLVASFYDLYNRFFQRLSFWYATNMWWDAVASAYECGTAVRGRSEEETRLQDAMFDALVRTLAINSSECQRAALHGLGHLHHPAVDNAIADYLARNSTLDPELREYATHAALGLIQ